MKKITFIIITIILSMVVCGCGQAGGLSLKAEIDKYSPSFSSVPGIPLIAEFERNLRYKDYKFHWVAEYGTFLKWHNETNGRIEILGHDVSTNEHKVYWSPLSKDSRQKSSFSIYLTIEEVDTLKVIDSTSLKITVQDGYYMVHN